MAGLIRDVDVLNEGFVPERLLYREGQLRMVAEALADGNVFVWGPTGTGKTCGAQAVLAELKQDGMKGAYVNCWKHRTKFGTLAEALRGLDRFVLRQGVAYDEVAAKLRAIQGVVMLDEVDKLDEDGIIYDFLSAGVRLLLISNDEHALGRLDGRICSRLAGLETIVFPRYRDDELVEILQARVRAGLAEGAVTDAQLRRLADAAAGDCRVALAYLRKAAEKAERTGAERVGDAAIAAIIANGTVCGTAPLNAHQKLLLGVMGTETLQTGVLQQLFSEACKKQNLPPIQPRTYGKYMDQLVENGLVEAKGEGRWRTYRVYSRPKK